MSSDENNDFLHLSPSRRRAALGSPAQWPAQAEVRRRLVRQMTSADEAGPSLVCSFAAPLVCWPLVAFVAQVLRESKQTHRQTDRQTKERVWPPDSFGELRRLEKAALLLLLLPLLARPPSSRPRLACLGQFSRERAPKVSQAHADRWTLVGGARAGRRCRGARRPGGRAGEERARARARAQLRQLADARPRVCAEIALHSNAVRRLGGASASTRTRAMGVSARRRRRRRANEASRPNHGGGGDHLECAGKSDEHLLLLQSFCCPRSRRRRWSSLAGALEHTRLLST